MSIPHALIACAGRGERMRPHSDHTPKPLLVVQGKPLVVWHLEALARAGVREVVINTAWLEEQFPAALGDGARWGLNIRYSMEGKAFGGALETAGGIANALELLVERPEQPFWYLAGDIFLPGFELDAGALRDFEDRSERVAELWMTTNAPHHPQGDFGIDDQGLARSRAAGWTGDCLTWTSIGLMRAGLVEGVPRGVKLPLRPCFEAGIAARRIGARRLATPWVDVGTPERLAALNESL